MTTIRRISTRDARFPLPAGAGVDATHSDPEYSFACALLEADDRLTGFGSAFTLGAGNDVVCRLAAQLAEPLVGREVEELMADWGAESRRLADHPQLRWLGPHKGRCTWRWRRWPTPASTCGHAAAVCRCGDF